MSLFSFLSTWKFLFNPIFPPKCGLCLSFHLTDTGGSMPLSPLQSLQVLKVTNLVTVAQVSWKSWVSEFVANFTFLLVKPSCSLELPYSSVYLEPLSGGVSLLYKGHLSLCPTHFSVPCLLWKFLSLWFWLYSCPLGSWFRTVILNWAQFSSLSPKGTFGNIWDIFSHHKNQGRGLVQLASSEKRSEKLQNIL